VEDRLPILIQKQLDAEIKQRPPLFPWETEVDDYESTEPESGHPRFTIVPCLPPEVTSD
jgi:hypothetical protein